MWLAVRQDLDLSPGKLAGQSGHAFGRLYLTAMSIDIHKFKTYLEHNEPKIVVKAANEAALLRVQEEATKAGIPCQLIRDAGRTELEPETATVCAFGPTTREDLPSFLRRLQLM